MQEPGQSETTPGGLRRTNNGSKHTLEMGAVVAGFLEGGGNGYTFAMGLTIHYQGQLRSEDHFDSFMQLVQAFANGCGWPVHEIPQARRELVRMLQPEDPDAAEVEEVYDGPTRGVYLLPHPECEPLNLEFDHDLFMQDWCKTQFAGAAIHAKIVQLFRKGEEMFEMLDVQDEAGLWEAGDTAESRLELDAVFRRTRGEIEEAAAESPGCSVGVLTPSGRILDILAA